MERIRFSGWTTLSGLSNIVATHGVNMLLNMFCGVFVNAAYGIVTLVSNAMFSFGANLCVAANPQITKNYAKGDMGNLYRLIFNTVKFSFIIIVTITVPLVLNMDFILRLWLKTVPEYAVVFCQIRVTDLALCIFLMPLSIAISTTGKIRGFMTVDSIFLLMNFVLSYVLLSRNHSPTVVFWISIFINAFRFIVVLFFSKKLYGLPVGHFCGIGLKLFVIALVTVPLPIFVSLHAENWVALFATTACFVLPFLFGAFFFGLDKSERNMIFSLVKNRFK